MTCPAPKTPLSLCLHVPPLRSGASFLTARSGQGRLHIQGQTSKFSTSYSAWSMWAIFRRGAPHERASPASRSPPLVAARYCHASQASASQPSTDSAWQDFSCFGVEDGCFQPVDGSGRACGSAARCCGETAAIWRLLPPRAAAGRMQGWPVDGQAGQPWRAAGAGAAARRSAERAEEHW